jgi:hypothetical protein
VLLTMDHALRIERPRNNGMSPVSHALQVRYLSGLLPL